MPYTSSEKKIIISEVRLTKGKKLSFENLSGKAEFSRGQLFNTGLEKCHLGVGSFLGEDL